MKPTDTKKEPEKIYTPNIVEYQCGSRVINQSKPASVKGTFVKKTVISSSMGPGIKLDISDVLSEVAV